jgi:hypothetical protein
MFPTQSKVYRSSSLWLLPVIALAMLLVGYAVFAASTAQAATPAGDFCIEGIVIDWEEHPLAGWEITLTADVTIPNSVPEVVGGISSTVSAADPNDEDDISEQYAYEHSNKKYKFQYPEDEADLQKGEFEFQDLLGVAGNYTATIESRPGWEGVTPTTLSFPIEVGEDGCVQIRFKMRQIVPVIVYKIDANHRPLGDWKIQAVPGPGNLFASAVQGTTATSMTTSTNPIIDEDPNNDIVTQTVTGTVVFSLTPGLWIFTEQAPKLDANDPRESYVPVVPPTARQELLIPDDLTAGTALTVVFKNELVTGCFVVRKTAAVTDAASPVDGGFGVGGWGFKLLRADGTVARQGVTDAIGELRFDDLPLGPYTLVEEDRPGWDEVSARELAIDVTGNMCDNPALTVEFVNAQDNSGFCIEGRKIDANGGYGIMGWEMTIEALDEGGALPVADVNDPNSDEVDSTTTNGIGKFRFDFLRNDYRVPGARYEVCEAEQDGWLPHTPTCQTVRLPEWQGACVQLEDFVNQQVGHTESQDYGKGYDNRGYDNGKASEGNEYGNEYGKGGPESGPSYGRSDSSSYGNRDSGQGYGNNNAQCSEYYVVKSGEGLYEIGRQYNKTPQQMLDANPSVQDGDQMWVYEGQRICIP